MNRFITKHADVVTGVLSGFDRLVFRGLLRPISDVGGLKQLLWKNNVLLKDFGPYAQRLTTQLRDASLRAAQTQGRPVQYLPSSDTDKEAVARRIAERDGITSGLIAVLTCIEPCTSFDIYKNRDAKRLELVSRFRKPVRFSAVEYIRVGSYTKKLHDFPEKERALWKTFDATPFESSVATGQVMSDDVLAWLDYPKYFELMGQSLPDNRAAILQRLESERIIIQETGDRYSITNLGAILFARDLKYFARLARKALRMIIYKGTSRVETIKEHVSNQGYAVGFESAIAYINDQLPHNEQIGAALRKEVRMYPKIAIRELVANALIHQDFIVTDAGPMVEMFTDRMEVTNPGKPLIETLRFIDEPPQSRNESLAGMMRRMTICEERGSGIDKVISQVEVFQLPAPDFRVSGHNTLATLLGPRTFRQLNRAERIRACYQHACLLYVTGQRMSNASFRKRLGIADKNYPQASSIIQDTIREKLIKPHGKGSASKRDSTYVPFWV